MTAIIPLYAREIVLRTGVYSKDLTERPVIVMKSRERMNRAQRMERGSGARARAAAVATRSANQKPRKYVTFALVQSERATTSRQV